jgi:hypothetical protein
MPANSHYIDIRLRHRDSAKAANSDRRESHREDIEVTLQNHTSVKTTSLQNHTSVKTALRKSKLARQLGLSFGLSAMAVGVSAPAQAETREYMMNWFIEAANSMPDDSDCPQGLNGLPEEMVTAQLRAVGLSKELTETLVSQTGGAAMPPAIEEQIIYRGRDLEGRPMHAYAYPISVPDLKLMKRNVGPYAYGFNLDGKVDPDDFTDPDSNEKGVDNAYWASSGCQINQRGSRNAPPTYGSRHWDIARDKQAAWLIRLEAADFTKDGDVTVHIFRAMERGVRDATGEQRRYWTFRRDPDPRWQNVFKGKIKDGMITAEGQRFEILGDPYGITNLKLRVPKFRGFFQADGSLEAVLGGYLPWKTLYMEGSNGGPNYEFISGTNIPALYHSLKGAADATPDPVTGQNTEISTAWRINAIPAFIKESDKVTTPTNLPFSNSLNNIGNK